MPEYSFDIVSRVDHQEVLNAVDQTRREVATRYDFRGSAAQIDYAPRADAMVLRAAAEIQLNTLRQVLFERLAKRSVPLRALRADTIVAAGGGVFTQTIHLEQGINQDVGRAIHKEIKASGLKVTAQVRDDEVRVSGKSRDDLQAIIALVKGKDFGVDLQFVNLR